MLVTAVSAAALLAGGVALVSILRSQLIDNLDATLLAQATDRAELLSEGADPELLDSSTLSEALVWIGTSDGTTLAATGRAGEGRPADLSPGVRNEAGSFRDGRREERGSDTDEETLRIAVVTATQPNGTTVVVAVGSELEVVDDPVKTVTRAMLAGAPLLLAIVGALTWVTADRALRPVDSIRRGAEAVGAGEPGGSVPVPATGDEIERLAVTVNEMLGALQAQSLRQRQFVADASHELKSPLATLRLEVETTSGLDPETQARRLRQIDRLTAIVDDLLVLARTDEHHSEPHSPVDIDEAVFDALELAPPRAGISVDIEAIAPTRVNGDSAQLRRLVRNLIDNARRHATANVSITLSSDEETVTLYIDDDGPGVPPESREAVFERFARTDESRAREDGGTGLGLAIARQIAHRHEGTIEVLDSPLGGARFAVTLPLVRSS